MYLFIYLFTMNSAQRLFRELPYNNIEFIEVHGQFNNSLNNNLTTKNSSNAWRVCTILMYSV